jgi:hypothetical protein
MIDRRVSSAILSDMASLFDVYALFTTHFQRTEEVGWLKTKIRPGVVHLLRT